ncbi:hypothetical protein VNI00_010192 [Paramarasmius palmivorus]|uniref:Uncharacterized protein n=1 Tax=Paramarasmius palmivorus TaxID=297713 RepID=A0AAW0CL76_9AGAR
MLYPNYDFQKAGGRSTGTARKTKVREPLRDEPTRTFLQGKQYVENARKGTHPHRQALDFSSENTETHQTGTRDCLTWRITEQNQEGNSEETVFTVQGIIIQCDLPPVLRPFGKNTTPRNVQQRVVITGLDQPTFIQAIEGLNRINAFLRRQIREETIPDIHISTGEHHTIEVSNRYFTSQRFAGNEAHVTFPQTVDPKGHLERLKSSTYVHTTENDVAYYERIVDGNGKQKVMDPSRFRVGDIVEIQLTLTLAEMQRKATGNRLTRNNEERYKTRLVLRGITMLDSEFSEAVRVQPVVAKSQSTTLKRKIGYFAEEELQTRDDLKKMAIDAED